MMMSFESAGDSDQTCLLDAESDCSSLVNPTEAQRGMVVQLTCVREPRSKVLVVGRGVGYGWLCDE
jgi:hypothetical protein